MGIMWLVIVDKEKCQKMFIIIINIKKWICVLRYFLELSSFFYVYDLLWFLNLDQCRQIDRTDMVDTTRQGKADQSQHHVVMV